MGNSNNDTNCKVNRRYNASPPRHEVISTYRTFNTRCCSSSKQHNSWSSSTRPRFDKHIWIVV